MENTNEYLNEDVVLEEEELETSEDVSEESDSNDDDSVTLSKAELNKLKRKAIAYDHAKSKQETKPEIKKVINNNNNNSASIEETVLKAQGLEEDEIDMLKKVSAISGVSLIDAQKDTVFKLWKEKQETEEKSRKASMGTSKGSSAKAQKGFNTPGLSEAEFKEMWKQKMGR